MSKQETSQDTGLGLSQFVTGHVQSEQEASPVEEASTTPEPEKTESEAAPAEKVEKPLAESKEKEKPAAESKTGRDATGKFVKKDTSEKKADKKPEVSPVDTSKASNWDSDENPYKKQLADAEKRRKDTERWGQEAHRRSLELQKQLDKINRKLDGTWSEEDERAEKQAQQRSPEVDQFHAELRGKARASKLAAVERFGAEQVEGWLTKFNELFGDDELVNARIMSSDMPVFEAINAVRGYEFFEKYGQDPDKIIAKLTEELREKMSAEVQEKEAQRIAENLKHREENPIGLGKVRSASVPADRGEKEDKSKPKPLGSLFKL